MRDTMQERIQDLLTIGLMTLAAEHLKISDTLVAQAKALGFETPSAAEVHMRAVPLLIGMVETLRGTPIELPEEKMSNYYWAPLEAETGSSDHGPFDTRKTAMDAAYKEYDGPFCTGRRVDVSTQEFVEVNADYILEHMSELAGGECGEAAEDWPDLDRAQEKELEAALKVAIVKFFEDHNLGPKFWKVEDVMDHSPKTP